MYDEKNLIYIFTMLECTEKCWIYTKSFSDANDLVRANEQKDLNAIISLFIAIGEESKKIDNNLKEDINIKLNWSEVAGMRDKISHNYRGVDQDILWAILQKDLSVLKNALIEMLKLIDNKSLIEEFLQSPYYKHLVYLKDIIK